MPRCKVSFYILLLGVHKSQPARARELNSVLLADHLE